MAEQTISGQRWPEGMTVTVYPAAAWVDRSRSPVGAPVTAAVVTSGSVSFGGLTLNVSYVAYGSNGTGVTFMATTENLQVPVAKPDRERITALEQGVTGGGSLAMVEDETLGYQATAKKLWIGWTDPTAEMDTYDQFIAIPEPD